MPAFLSSYWPCRTSATSSPLSVPTGPLLPTLAVRLPSYTLAVTLSVPASIVLGVMSPLDCRRVASNW
ncbi:hypothetical protein NB689_002175 [Xanthomonas sacchari]|nr:hypothetical protein [Xanthomonas sacchari]